MSSRLRLSFLALCLLVATLSGSAAAATDSCPVDRVGVTAVDSAATGVPASDLTETQVEVLTQAMESPGSFVDVSGTERAAAADVPRLVDAAGETWQVTSVEENCTGLSVPIAAGGFGLLGVAFAGLFVYVR